MVEINHDWDETNYVDLLGTAFDDYRKSCYGDREMSPVQLQEVKQAFLSGIHWLNTETDYCPDDIESALKEIILKEIIGRHNPLVS